LNIEIVVEFKYFQFKNPGNLFRYRSETYTEKNVVFFTATKLGTRNKFVVAATKNFAAATKRFVDRTKHFVFVTKYFCYSYFNK